MTMRLLLSGSLLALLMACATPVLAGRYAGTWRTTGSEDWQLRVSPGDDVELFAPADGRRLQTRLQFSGPRGSSGVLPNGEVVSLGGEPGRLQMSIGTSLYKLQPLAPERFAQATAAPPVAGGAGPVGAPGEDVPALAGVKLHRVSTSAGGGSESIYTFCANGSYRYAFQSLSGGSLAAASEDAGSWRQSGATVQLESRKGSQALSLRRISPLRIEVNGRTFSLGRSGC